MEYRLVGRRPVRAERERRRPVVWSKLRRPPATGHGVLSLTTFPGCLPPWHLAVAGSRSRTPYVTRGFLPFPPLPSPRVRVSVSVQTCASPPHIWPIGHRSRLPPPTSTARVPCAGRRRRPRAVLAPPRARRATVPAQRSAANRSDTHRGGPSGTLLSIDQQAALNMHAYMFFVRLSRLLDRVKSRYMLSHRQRRRRTGLLFHRSSMFRHAPFRPFDFPWVFSFRFPWQMTAPKPWSQLWNVRSVMDGRQARGSSFRPVSSPLNLKENVLLSARLSRPPSTRISSQSKG
jgi:hypothetical protein